MIRRLFLGLLACAMLAPAFAAAQEPIDVVKKFYVENQNNSQRYEPWSKRLRRLYDAAAATSKKLDQPVSGIDFDPTVNGQDTEEGFLKSVRADQTQRAADKARIKVTFKNGRLSELWYDMILESGAWVVNDIHSVRGESKWVWSKLLADGAKGK